MSSLLRPHYVLLMIVLFSSSVFAASKIRGKVTDKQSGEPLIGASVVIEGTTGFHPRENLEKVHSSKRSPFFLTRPNR